MKQTFPKTARLLSRKDFSFIRKQGSRIWSQSLVASVHVSTQPRKRLGLSVSKRYGNAVQRNRFKRRIRELFRRENDAFPSGTTLHISPVHKNGEPPFSQLKSDFISLFKRLKKKH